MKLLLLIILSAFCAISTQETCPQNKKIIVCYYASWGVYREGAGHIEVENIDSKLCTHLVYTFTGLNVIQNAISSLDPWNDYAADGGKDSFRKFIQLKEFNPCLKTLLAIGGWNEKSRKYSVMASTPESRIQFADNIVRFLAQYEFDGFDFDWEYPATRGGIVADKANFVELLKELKKRFKPWDFLLTIAVAATEDVASKAYSIKEISDIVDYVSIMAYDYTASTSKTTGLLAPLKPVDDKDKTPTIDGSVNYWIKNGCDVSKIILGIPIYARSFLLKDKNNNGIGAETIPNTLAGKYTKEIGFLSTYELSEILLTQDDYKVTKNPSYANNYATNGTYWFTYDTEETVKAKVEYAKTKGLGGIMAWSLDTDDFQGTFSDEPYPILNAINAALYK